MFAFRTSDIVKCKKNIHTLDIAKNLPNMPSNDRHDTNITFTHICSPNNRESSVRRRATAENGQLDSSSLV